MKKILLFVLMAVLSTQMWATVYAYAAYGNGSTSAMGTIQISTDKNFGNSITQSANSATFYAKATANKGYKFVGWGIDNKNSVTKKENPTSKYLSGNVCVYFCAFFEKDDTPSQEQGGQQGGQQEQGEQQEQGGDDYTKPVYVAVVDFAETSMQAMGKIGVATTSNVTVGNGAANDSYYTCSMHGNFTAYYKAVANEGYKFLGWKTSPANTFYSKTAAEFSALTLSESTTYYACFAQKDGSETEQGGQQEQGEQQDDTKFAAVDLGLSVKWANMNLGATSSTSAGTFFAWGGTPSSPTTVADGPWSNGTTTQKANPVVEDKDGRTYRFQDEEDAAHVAKGGEWHVPTKAQMEELVANCTIVKDGNGYRFTSKVNGKSIYMPMTGYYGKTGVYNDASYDILLYYWTNTWVSGTGTGDNKCAWALKGTQVSNSSTYAGNRYQIRPVLGGQTVSPIVAQTVKATFMNGTTKLADVDVAKGGTPAYNGATPTKDADTYYTYEFDGWEPALGAISENTTYTAKFKSTKRTYTINFLYRDGDYEEVIEEVVCEAGQIPVCKQIEEYAFVGIDFAGWEPSVVAATENATYVAKFISNVSYTITIGAFQNGKVTVTCNGQSRLLSASASAQQIEVSEGANVVIAATANRFYHFNGWTGVEENNMKRSLKFDAIETNISLTPAFAANIPITLADDKTKEEYNQIYTDNADQYMTVTMSSRIFDPGKWGTFCVPFNYAVEKENALYDHIYELDDATSAMGGNAIKLRATQTYELEANVPYLVKFPEGFSGEFVCDGVKFMDAEDNDPQVVETTDFNFISVPYPTTIFGPSAFYAGASSLVKAQDGGTPINAFRAYFQANASSAPRRLIIVTDEGEEELDILDSNGQSQDTDKYIENGTLIIERNGARFNAVGDKVE